MAFSPDGRRLAIRDQGDGALIWEMAGDRQIKLRADQGLGRAARGLVDRAPSPVRPRRPAPRAGRSRPERDPTAQALTRLRRGDGRAPGSRFAGATAPLAFSRDGRRLIALDPEKGGVEARVFDPADGRELARLRGHTGPILAAAFSPDGARIVTSSRDGTVKVWDAAGRELMTLPGTAASPSHLRFSADGTGSSGPTTRPTSSSGRPVLPRLPLPSILRPPTPDLQEPRPMQFRQFRRFATPALTAALATAILRARRPPRSHRPTPPTRRS